MSVSWYAALYGPQSLNHQLFMLLNHSSSLLLDLVMPFMTFLADARMFYLYVLALALISFVARDSFPMRYVMVFFVAILLSWGMEAWLKALFHVPRPAAAIGIEHIRVLGEVKLRNSFPSGHTILAFMAAYTLGYGRKWWWKLLLYLFAVLVGYSRIYVGAHYPLDVLGGVVVGTVCGLVAWQSYGLIEHYRKRRGREVKE